MQRFFAVGSHLSLPILGSIVEEISISFLSQNKHRAGVGAFFE